MESGDYTSLMVRRVRRILLVCNNYDSFALEEDGHIDVQIAQEYAELNLSNPPLILRAETTTQALGMAQQGEQFDLVITMNNAGSLDVFDFAESMKLLSPDTPIVLLSAFSKQTYRNVADHKRQYIDYFFCWNNSADLIIAIIKLLEDRMNADHDILEEGGAGDNLG